MFPASSYVLYKAVLLRLLMTLALGAAPSSLSAQSEGGNSLPRPPRLAPPPVSAENPAEERAAPRITPPQSAAPAQTRRAAPLPANARRGATSPRKACAAGCLSPIEAVTYADNVAPRAGIAAEFDMIVRSIGEVQGRYYLNSETDYRERNCLSIVLTPHVAQTLAGTIDLNKLAVMMKGKRIAVQGIARRVRIDFTEDGQPTGKYYYQVHVVVTDPRQIVMN